MFANLRSLFIAPDKGESATFWQALEPEIYFIEKSNTSSFQEALDLLLYEKVDVCFVSVEMPATAIESFANDANKVANELHTPLVLVRDKLVPGFDRLSDANARFVAVISRQSDVADKQALAEALRPFEKRIERAKEIKAKVLEVSDMIHLLIRQVDAVARDKKRGAPARYRRIFSDFVADLSAFDEEVLNTYYDQLENEAGKVLPVGFDSIDVPSEVLAKGLPKLSSTTYSGASRRVWDRLFRKWGTKPEEND